jgi:hypothetical protein
MADKSEADKTDQLIEACSYEDEKKALRLLRTMKDDEIRGMIKGGQHYNVHVIAS